MSLEAKLAVYMRMLGYDTAAADTQVIANKLIRHVDLINKWNRVHNLTSIRKPEDMLTHHIMDSLAVLPQLGGIRLADVGSGAGLPGIPIAVARPSWHVVLIESNQKKAAFLKQAKIELELNNIQVFTGRAEDFLPVEKFNTVISRALCSLREFIILAGHLCADGKEGGRLVAMKGEKPNEELRQMPANYFIEEIFPIAVPGLAAKRHLVVINIKDE
jgi:16S rRNA (guanine527-N7)-methyltransferase